MIFSCRVVVHSKVNKNDYTTLSLNGFTRLVNGTEAEFVKIDQWLKDYENFNHLLKIKTFAVFKKWKMFATWRMNVRKR